MESIRLNLGSNSIRIPGFLNVDLVNRENVDIVANAKDLPYDDNSVEEILSCHLIEHFDFREGLEALKEWFRVLIPGGKLTIECPNFESFCRKFLELPENERQNYYAQVWGFPWEDGQAHKFGYTPGQMIWSLSQTGFSHVRELPAKRYDNLQDWCMKFECKKPGGDTKIEVKEPDHVLCMIPTKNRYMSSLPMAITSIINQTVKPNELVIIDDSETPMDLRENSLYVNLFQMLTSAKIEWKVLFGRKIGQHYSHQMSQDLAKKLIYRIDDDNVPNSNVLEILLKNMKYDVGAVGGLVLLPEHDSRECLNNPIDDLSDNCQWHKWSGKKEVQHLYSSFLYRKGIVDYELNLSPAAHTEETIFTHRLYKKGYKLIVDSEAVTMHFRNKDGGIRPYPREFFEKDARIFKEIKREWDGHLICYLDNGKGDHVVFKSILPELKEKYKKVSIACCYPDIFPGEEVMSIEDGKKLVTPDRFNVYKFMNDKSWKTELVEAFRKMYFSI